MDSKECNQRFFFTIKRSKFHSYHKETLFYKKSFYYKCTPRLKEHPLENATKSEAITESIYALPILTSHVRTPSVGYKILSYYSNELRQRLIFNHTGVSASCTTTCNKLNTDFIHL